MPCVSTMCADLQQTGQQQRRLASSEGLDENRLPMERQTLPGVDDGVLLADLSNRAASDGPHRKLHAERRREERVHAALHDLLDHGWQQLRKQAAAAVQRGARDHFYQVHLREHASSAPNRMSEARLLAADEHGLAWLPLPARLCGPYQ